LRQINALVEKLALHFLQSCCGPLGYPRKFSSARCRAKPTAAAALVN
jgi:hypothetical protein